MIVLWIVLGIIGWIGPIIPVFWRMKHKLLSKGKRPTLGNVYKEFDPEEVMFAVVPVINIVVAILCIVDGLFIKYRDVEI